MSEYIIEMRDITGVNFPGIKANDRITLKLKRGEIHALLGEKRRRQKHLDEHPLWPVPAGQRGDL